MSRLIYHSEESYDRGVSPFDRAIRETADSEEVSIVCPYIGPSYVNSILKGVDEWRIVTDVEAWIAIFSGEARESTQKFIEENRERVHDFPDVHAKVVLSENSAVIGSANLTEKGVVGRTEMGVRFSEEEKIAELREWYNRLWSESSPVDLEELDEFVRTSPSASSAHSQSTASLSSDAPRVSASFVEDDDSPIPHSVAAEEDDDRRMTADRFFGGVDNRIKNLRAMLDYIAEESPEESVLWAWLRDNTSAEEETTMETYVRFIRTLGLIRKDGKDYSIADSGDYFRNTGDADFLYRLLSENVKGFQTILAALSEQAKSEEQFPDYSLSTGVIIRHLEWLQSIGYIEKSNKRYSITDEGLSSVRSP